jgi:glycosyltransferase involved in cell wall biosynthesis
MKISLIIPSYNNLQHLKNAYNSIQKHAPKSEVILLDDGSTDGTWEWIQDQDCIKYRSEERVGHTILYDVGIEMASNDVVGILHADMIIGPNYVENLLKHLKPGTVVCATRIEPPLHPEGKEKIIKDFGMDFDSLDVKSFEGFCLEKIEEHKDQTTNGMFAPWILFKEDFKSIGGHDPLFAPFPYEDSDIFQRWILAGYNLIQSRDAFVYHLTCRGHRWNKEIGKNDEEFAIFESKARRNYIRKWGSWIKNDEYQHPTIPPKYNIGYRVENCHLQLLEALEPWCDRIYVDELFKVIGRSHDYIEMEQKNTSFDLSKRIHTLTDNDRYDYDDILVEINGKLFTQQDFQTLQQLPEILQDSGEEGSFELGNLKITISSLETYEKGLIVCSSQYVL